MNKVLFSVLMISAMLVLASCGSKKNSEEKEAIVLTPETTHIKGDLSDYFEVVDKEYTVTDDWGDMVSIEVKRTDIAYDFELEGVAPYGTYGRSVTGNAGFGIEILDENGNVIDKTSATASGLSGMYSSDDMKEALKLKSGETGTVRWSFHFDDEKKPAKFRLTSAYEEVNSSESNSGYSDSDSSSFDDDAETESSSSSGSEDWDSILDSYEEYVDKYISLAKKAANGDASAMSEYAELAEEAQELSSKLSNAKGELSSSQLSRYTKITQKMASAAQQMR